MSWPEAKAVFLEGRGMSTDQATLFFHDFDISFSFSDDDSTPYA